MLQDKFKQKESFHQNCKTVEDNGNSGQIGYKYLH